MTECWRQFDVAVGQWRLGELMAERLPAVALSALSDGCDAPSLGHSGVGRPRRRGSVHELQLAAMDGAGWSEVEPLVARVLEQRGRAVPREDEALKCVADDVVCRMVCGEVAPEKATARLRGLSMKAADDPAWEDLGAFHHLALDWEFAEDARLAGLRGADLDALRDAMMREGRELMARGGVRLS